MLKQDLETFAVPLNLKWRWKEESQGTTLEKNWTDIVDSHSTMSRIQRHQQEALWEFVHTELTYINKLIIITDLVIAALVNLHQHGFLLEVTPELLFFDLPSILTAHQLFWQEVIYPMLEEVRRTGQPFDPMALEAGCLQVRTHLVCFCLSVWVETHPQCERMRLGDMQAKPHQRITKYPLLLMAVLKTTQDPNVQHTLRGMLSSVNSFLESINDHLKLQDEQLALNISAQRVEGYEVEPFPFSNNTEHYRFLGVGPEVVRKLLLEENLKIRERKDMALLFSDVLLMTKVQKKGERLKVVRPPLALDRTYCIALKDGCDILMLAFSSVSKSHWHG
uniref:Pleckstrin homology domain containing, family G (with RhoGef domain) member 6 n=1 Tax=Cyclopterus lumpus TaxID=8103 RepID=A0A8C2WID5_CYCLU